MVQPFTSEVGIQHIQQQIDNCDTIVDNIDIIVPKLYKIRQQALAQKEYINDASRLLISQNDFDGTERTTNELVHSDKKSVKYVGTGTDNLATIDVFNGTVAHPSNTQHFTASFTADEAGNAAKAKYQNAIQSIFKFKHDCGTQTHFTSDQIGVEDDRTKGFNLSDVVSVTSGMNELLKHDSTTASAPAALNDLNNLLLKPVDDSRLSVVPNGHAGLLALHPNTSSYQSNLSTSNGMMSLYSGIVHTEKILGFGLSD